MNNELFLNETTKVGLVSEDKNGLKIVKSNNNDKTIEILDLENKIEIENKEILKLKKQLKETNNDIKYKFTFLIGNIFAILFSLVLACSLPGTIIYKIIYMLITAGTFTLIFQQKIIASYGTFKEKYNNKQIIPEKLQDAREEYIKLNENLKKLKENSDYIEKNMLEEQELEIPIINYPERTNDETLVSDIQIPAKIKKITFNNNGTTK